MKRLAFLFWLCCAVAHADEASIRLRGGGANTPFFTQAFPSTLGHGLVLQLAGDYRLNEHIKLAAQLPLVWLEIAQPAGSYVNEFSWGNANFTLSQHDELWRAEHFTMFGIAGLSLALPIAEWGPRGSMMSLRALQVANGMDGFRTPELYTAGTIPLAPSYGVSFEGAKLAFDASLRVPMFARFSRARLARDADVRWFAVTPVLHFGARYAPVRWFQAELAADTVFNAAAPVRFDGPTTQFSLVPVLAFPIREQWLLRADFVLPIAGTVGGNAYAGGLQLALRLR